MAETLYGENLTYTDLSTVYSGDEIKRNHGLNQQMSGALSAVAPGVRTGWGASIGSGLTVNVTAGEGVVTDSDYGAVALRSAVTLASAAIPASSVGYIHALVEKDVSPGGNRSVETMLPKFVYSDLNTLENALCIAYVVSGAGSITAVYDRRRIIDPQGDVYGGLFAQDDANTVGLTVAFFGGRLAQADGTVISVNPFNKTVASGDSYIDIDEDGAAYVRTSSTPVAGHKCIWAATANSTEIVTATSARDRRTGFDFGAGGSGGADVLAGSAITVTDNMDGTKTVSIADAAITDAKIGQRTVDQTLATPGHTGPLTSLLSWIVGRIKAITGETNWYDAPDITLAATKTHVDAAAPHTGHLNIDGSNSPSTDMDWAGFKLTNLADGSGPQDAATKAQVDAVASGYKDLENVKAMSTANLALSGLGTMDGVALSGSDRVLLVAQTTQSENGPWLASAGAWTRPADFDTGDTPEAGTRIFVVNGTAKKGTSWTLISAGAVIGTDPLVWTQTGAAGTGEANTASNVGTGTGLIFKAKSGLDLVFKSIKAASSKLSVTNNTDDITLDVVEANIDINALGGSALTVANGGLGLASIPKGSLLYASAADTLALLTPNSDGVERYVAQTDDGAPVRKAVTVAGYAGTSTTSIAIGTGSKAFTTQAGLGYSAGQRLRAVSSSDPTKFIEGVVASYSGTALVITSDKTGGSGSVSNWNINVTGEPGAAGTNGTNGTNGTDGADGAGFLSPVALVDGATVTIDADSSQDFHLDAMAGNQTMAITGTPTEMGRLAIRLTASGGAQTPAWNTTTGSNKVNFDRVVDPGSITSGDDRYYVFRYNLPKTQWDCVSVV